LPGLHRGGLEGEREDNDETNGWGLTEMEGRRNKEGKKKKERKRKKSK
jgi:hypothetical protein